MKLLKPRIWLTKLLLIVAIIAFFLLDHLEYLHPVKTLLSSEMLSFRVGKSQFSVYLLIKTIITVFILFWLTRILTDFVEVKIKAINHAKANHALLIKVLQITIYFIAFIIGLDVVGIDLTTLTVFSGAVGIGIGIGLQKVASNFISGLILLIERSVETNDLIELSDGTQGIVHHTGARYTLIEAYDGKEIMIPNEDFVTNRVINWTYSNTKGRIEIHVGVAYESDIEQVRMLLLEAAKQHPRCLSDPAPACYLHDFAESSIDFLLFFWVNNVFDGRLESKSDVMRAIWQKFKAHNITIPYPQRDLHFKQG